MTSDFEKLQYALYRATNKATNLDGVWPAFAQWLLMDAEHGVQRCIHIAELRDACKKIADYYAGRIDKNSLNDISIALEDSIEDSGSIEAKAINAAGEAANVALDDTPGVARRLEDVLVFALAAAQMDGRGPAWIAAATKTLTKLSREKNS